MLWQPTYMTCKQFSWCHFHALANIDLLLFHFRFWNRSLLVIMKHFAISRLTFRSVLCDPTCYEFRCAQNASLFQTNLPTQSSCHNPLNDVLVLQHDFNRFCCHLIAVKKCRPGKSVQMTEQEVRGLCLKSREIFLQQPILLELEAPLSICGEYTQGKWCFA